MPAMPHISSKLLQTERPADAALDVLAEDGVVAPDVVAMPERRVEHQSLGPRLRCALLRRDRHDQPEAGNGAEHGEADVTRHARILSQRTWSRAGTRHAPS